MNLFPRPIHAKIVQDIKKQTEFIPRPHRHFYETLLEKSGADSEPENY